MQWYLDTLEESLETRNIESCGCIVTTLSSRRFKVNKKCFLQSQEISARQCLEGENISWVLSNIDGELWILSRTYRTCRSLDPANNHWMISGWLSYIIYRHLSIGWFLRQSLRRSILWKRRQHSSAICSTHPVFRSSDELLFMRKETASHLWVICKRPRERESVLLWQVLKWYTFNSIDHSKFNLSVEKWIHPHLIMSQTRGDESLSCLLRSYRSTASQQRKKCPYH